MKSKEEILAKRIVKFPEDPAYLFHLGVGSMTDESIKRNVYAAMEEYAAQFKDSPYQGSAGVWRSAAKPPGITQWYVVKCEQRRFASLIYVDSKITLERVAKDIDVEIDLLEWLDSAASPGGDGLKQHAIAFAEFVDRFVSDDHNCDMYWDNEGEQYTREMLYTEFMKPTPPNKSV